MTRNGHNCEEFRSLLATIGTLAAAKKMPCVVTPGEVELMRRRDSQQEAALKQFGPKSSTGIHSKK